MARLERGKGKRMQVTEIAQHGRVLRSRERHGDDLRLPGYRRCASEADARRSLRTSSPGANTRELPEALDRVLDATL